MWTRKQLKENAKNVLSKYYWTAFAMSLVLNIVLGSNGATGYYSILQIPETVVTTMSDSGVTAAEVVDKLASEPELLTFIVLTVGFMLIISFFIWLISTALTIFLFNPFKAGKNAYYIRQREDCGKFGNLALAFKEI